jgi:hypothetical protein
MWRWQMKDFHPRVCCLLLPYLCPANSNTLDHTICLLVHLVRSRAADSRALVLLPLTWTLEATDAPSHRSLGQPAWLRELLVISNSLIALLTGGWLVECFTGQALDSTSAVVCISRVAFLIKLIYKQFCKGFLVY